MNDRKDIPKEEGEQIIDGERIALILNRLRREAASITVYVPGIESEGKTFILEVDPEAGLFSIDRIFPLEVQRAFAKAGRLQATAFLRSGARVMFFAEVSHFLEDASGAAIVCPIPDTIHYHQLREYFRVQLPPDLKGTIQLFESGNEAVAEGTLLDLSIGGVGAMVKSSEPIEVGQLFPRCKIMLPPLLPGLQTGLEIRRATPAQAAFRIGGRFVGLSGANLRQLERTVAELERILLKRNWRA